MALPTSGQLTFEQIGTELSISTSGPHSLRSMSSTAGKSVPDSVEEFYGYSHAVPVTPTKCSIGTNEFGFVQVSFFCHPDNDACQGRWRRNDTSWTSFSDKTNPWTLEACVSSKTYYAEVRGRIGTSYSSVCAPSWSSGSCPPV